MPNTHYDHYSVNASVMIKLKDMLPQDLFKPAWDEVGRLVAEGRWKIFENVADEVSGDTFKKWAHDHGDAIVKFDPALNTYMNALMAETQKNGLMLIDPASLRNNADPFVVMLGLYLEGRDLSDLRRRRTDKFCCVLTQEAPKKNKINIPAVCKYYDLNFMNLFDWMRYHGWRITLNVENP